MKAVAVIVAGGTGTRMGSSTPKQFLPLLGKPILWHTLQAFTTALNSTIDIILVAHKDYITPTEAIAESLGHTGEIKLIAGGDTRFQSVRNGVQAVTDDAVILVHDAVRCLVTKQLIENCYLQTKDYGSALPVVTATDSIRKGSFTHHEILNRNEIHLVQTPQCFLQPQLQQAFLQPESPLFTDEATVMEAAGFTVQLCKGDYDNIKITRQADLLLAEAILRQRAEANDTW
ncbi:MAG: 2-C-methyl-D-erythritol 4-phosphate cytidylyltransferase [Bacteroidetes bacterium]|nr:MAG: 2-C-methyl-D-erythritol 4-phosphate cytidylyltransferase [Bacteroidota bacterium]TAE63042.1 MAG: 2-C-methyl-D-erythritol 4-phosphate cytidylyltransferase [Bacteroidota bacterium]TAF95916.1 MAG: 2-C-methyl-D-erythritol 4-phosphate cytidylyltransferase [Bacteroidota bacterium]